MAARREHINEYFNGRGFMVLSAIALVVTAAVALTLGVRPVVAERTGVFFSFNGALLDASPMSAAVNVLCLLAASGIMLALNKVFTFVRSTTHLFASAFLWLQVANPQGLVCLNAGTLLCLVTAIATIPLFASFQDRHSQRSIFLIFALAATGSMFHYGFVALIPAFLLGFLNMGVLNLKGVLAMLFGLVTPFWIVLGLGIASPFGFLAPQVNGIWSLGADKANLVLILAAVTAVLGIVLALINLSTLMNYRMQTRVYNAFFVITLVMTVIAMCVDYSGVSVFLPLLGLMVSVQIAHAHTLHAATVPYRYVFLILFVAVCIAFGVANLMMR